MSVEAMAIVLHHSESSGTDKVVLIGIANHHGDGGSWPSVATLARYANKTERTVQNSIAKLVDLGELVVHQQDGGTHHTDPRYRPNRYEIVLRCPDGCDGTAQHRGVKDSAPLTDPGVKPVTSRGEAERDPGVKPTSPEPSFQPSLEPSLDPPSFDDFWAVYPRREAKAAAELKWRTAIKKTDPAVIMAGLRARVDYWQRARTQKQFIPHASVWLNQRRWEDEIGPVEANATSAARRERDRLERMRVEVDEAILAGDAGMAWEVIVQRAAADGKTAFVKAAVMLEQRGDEPIAMLTGLTVDEVAAIRDIRTRIYTAARSGTVTDGLTYSLPEVTDEVS